MDRRFVLVVASLVLAPAFVGCLGSSQPTGPSAEDGSGDETSPLAIDRITLSTECGTCFEPTVASASNGTVYVTESSSESIWVVDGPDVSTVPKPPLPPTATPTAGRGDSTVDVGPNGSLFFHALVENPGLGPANPAGLLGIQVARSDDGGQTWAANTFVGIPGNSRDAPGVLSDRQWLAADGEGNVYLTYSGYSGAGLLNGINVVKSQDGGRTWGDWTRVVSDERAGMLHIADDGRVLVPYLADADDRPRGVDDQVRIASSSDEGATWQRTTVIELSNDASFEGMHADLAQSEAGPIHAAWSLADGHVQRATSPASLDGFGEPVDATERGDLFEEPSVSAHEGIVDTVWFSTPGSGAQIRLHRAMLQGEDPGFTVNLTGPYDAEEARNEPVGSHFTDLAVADGRPVTAWTTGGALKLAYGPPAGNESTS